MKVFKIATLLMVLLLFSCSKDDDTKPESNYPRTVNLKFEAIADPGITGLAQIIINNDEDYYGDVPLNKTKAQIEIDKGTFLMIRYSDSSPYSNEYPYTVNLKIYENNSVIAEKQLNITDAWQEGYLEYTFE